MATTPSSSMEISPSFASMTIGGHDDTMETKGPSIVSEDVEERIQARRLRIAARVAEANK